MDLWLNCVSKSFPGLKVLDEVTADIPASTIVALLGSNGAGKTTLLRCLATLSSPDAGDIRVDGEILRRGNIALRKRLMFLPDFPDLFSFMDPLAVIASHLKLWEADRPGVEERVAELMDQLQIASLCGISVDTFSRGQRYKTTLAALIAVDPELWLLDEPFASGMDPQGIATFRTEAQTAVKERQRTLIYSTQMVEQACGFSDKVAVISRGRLTLYDTEKDLDRDPRKLDSMLIAPRS